MGLSLQAQNPSDNPFAGFETHMLPNDLKVWFKRMPGQANVALSVTVRVGSDQDPVGKEQMAHFLEHLQFSDHLGLSTQAIKKQIEERGGVWNASTGSERTFYFVHIKKEHVLFALDWLYRVISPHDLKADVVERERYPVEVEVGAKPREIMDWFDAWYLNLPLLRFPGTWEREFGIESPRRDFYTYRSLRSMTPQELKDFYDRYYSPSNMILTVIRDVDRDAALAQIDKTFSLLRQVHEPPPPASAKDVGRGRSIYFWDTRSNVWYARRFRFASFDADDDLMLTFIGGFLSKRLNDRLRFGEQKAVYGISTGLVQYGPSGYFQISGTIRESELDFALRVIEEELELLRKGSLDDATFEAERSVLIQQLRVSYSTPEALESWVGYDFNNRQRHRDFPDVLAAYQTIRKDEIARFVSTHFVPEREFNSTFYPLPMSQGVAGLMGLTLILGTVKFMKWLLVRPVDMKRIRYVAHFRIPRLLYLMAGIVLVVGVAVGLRVLVFAYQLFSDAFLHTHDSVVLQWSVYALMGMSVMAVLVLALALVPSKILVFDDSMLVKYVAYRSITIRLDEIADLSFQRFSGVWMSRRLWKCVPFKWGLFSPGIYLRRRDGWSYFFDVKDRKELVKLLEPQITRT
jgi:predicted Zn-dependent peptidase